MYTKNELLGFSKFFPNYNKLERNGKDLESLCDEFAKKREEIRKEAAAGRTIEANPWTPTRGHDRRR